MSKLPWRKWFPSEWLSDEQVGQTTPAARGLWAECLNRMLYNDTYRLHGPVDALARMLRFDPQEFKKALSDLSKTTTADIHVTKCNKLHNGNVTIVSRRLLREHKERERIKLAVRSSRLKVTCNGNVTSTSLSTSISNGKGMQGEGAKIPSKDEWLAICRMQGIPEWKAIDEFHRQEAADPPWGKARGNLASHAARVRSWWQSDGCPKEMPRRGSHHGMPDENKVRDEIERLYPLVPPLTEAEKIAYAKPALPRH